MEPSSVNLGSWSESGPSRLTRATVVRAHQHFPDAPLSLVFPLVVLIVAIGSYSDGCGGRPGAVVVSVFSSSFSRPTRLQAAAHSGGGR